MVSSRDAWTLAHSASLFIVRICYDEVQVEVESKRSRVSPEVAKTGI